MTSLDDPVPPKTFAIYERFSSKQIFPYISSIYQTNAETISSLKYSSLQIGTILSLSTNS